MNIRTLLGLVGLAFLFDRFAVWVVTRAKRTPYFHLKDYMERYWLFRRGEFGLADADGHGAPEGGEGTQGARPALAARVHVILRSDADEHLHDHPWPHLSIILSGGYWEDVPFAHRGAAWVGETRRVWRGPGAVVFRRATSLHKLHIPPVETARMVFDHEGSSIEDGDPIPGRCTSLFIMGPQVRRWGFATPSGWVYWRTYLFGESALPQLPHTPAWRVAWVAFLALFQRYPTPDAADPTRLLFIQNGARTWWEKNNGPLGVLTATMGAGGSIGLRYRGEIGGRAVSYQCDMSTAPAHWVPEKIGAAAAMRLHAYVTNRL